VFGAMVWILRVLVSPTRAVADFVKARKPDGGTTFIRRWHWTFFVLAPTSCIALYVIPASALPHVVTTYLAVLYLWAVPFSRCNEIFYAFLRDALDHLQGVSLRTKFSAVERVKLAVRSYPEIAFDFAIIYFFLPSCWFSRPFQSIVHAVYFSGVTITTVGYGDVTPSHPLSQLLVLYEIFVGLVLIVITLGTYLGQVSQNRPDQTG
jgi:voltage-gated potassium channel